MREIVFGIFAYTGDVKDCAANSRHLTKCFSNRGRVVESLNRARRLLSVCTRAEVSGFDLSSPAFSIRDLIFSSNSIGNRVEAIVAVIKEGMPADLRVVAG